MHIPYGKQFIDETDIQSVVDTLQSDFLTQGPKIAAFEELFAEYVGARFAVAVSNATAGLHIGSLALGLAPGQRVITSSITFAASANCIRYGGGEVWFADIHRTEYTLDPESVESLISSKPKGYFSGIIPVSFAGLPVDMKRFEEIAQKHNLWLMEDACHAPGGYRTYPEEGKVFAGSAHFGQLGVFSFHPVKHIACGEGGMVVTNSEELYKRLLSLRSHGITKENNTPEDGGWMYQMTELGFNYRMTDIQAALGIPQLLKNSKGVERRNTIAEKYKAAFKGIVSFQETPANCYHAHHLFIIEVKDRKGLYEYLKQQNIFSQVHYIPVHTLPYYKSIGYKDANLMRSEEYYSRCLSLPMFPTLTEKEQDYVIDHVLHYVSTT